MQFAALTKRTFLTASFLEFRPSPGKPETVRWFSPGCCLTARLGLANHCN
jgi:hypothetical protein